jgi:HCOMODA/2-hydroxy-3-carboxy-muconic semialdehyde decarboxylase
MESVNNQTASADVVLKAKTELVAANRILAREGVVDGYGHVSVRHPENPAHFFLSRSRSPELVEIDDIMEFTLDGKVVGDDARPPYLERFIHGSIYAARKDVNSVVHSHAEDVLPFSITKVPLRAVFHMACGMGENVPVWDIHKKFGDTNLLVTCVDHGKDLARTLGKNKVALMRGHGFACAAPTMYEAVRTAIYLPANARILAKASALGGPIKFATRGEIEKAGFSQPETAAFQRGWDYWLNRAGVKR